MDYSEIRRILSSYLYFYAGILCIPFLLAAFYQFQIGLTTHPQPHSTFAFAYTIIIALIAAYFLGKNTRKASLMMYRQRETLISVAAIWIITPLIGALPFLFSGTLDRFDQAYFEAASGFTTTGATILEGKTYDPDGKEIPIQKFNPLTNKIENIFYGTVKPIVDPFTQRKVEGIEAVGRALLFWRSFMQWIGGMGIIVLFVAFLPELGIQGKFLFQTESPGPQKEGFKPRIKETALQLWRIYLILTFIQIAFLFIVNPAIPFFDAVTLTFSTISTGGFSIHNDNIAYYRHKEMEWIIIIFMVLGSLNFSLYYHLLKGKFYRLFESELLCYLIILIFFGFFVVLQLNGTPQTTIQGNDLGNYSYSDAFRTGFFQLISAQTSTGFYVDAYDLWPYPAQIVLLIAMYLGGMTGSTAGGLKIIRVQILFKTAKSKIESIFQPKAVKLMRIGNREIDNGAALSASCFFFIAIALSILGGFLYICDGIDPVTALGLTASMVNTTGMAFKGAGPSTTMAFLSPLSTWLSSFLMILGRLEYYALLTLFFPSFWKIR